MYSAVNEIIHKQLGFDHIQEKIIQKLGNVQKVYLTGPLSQGLNQGPLEIILIGDKINVSSLNPLIDKVEKIIGRSIVHNIYKTDNTKTEYFKSNECLLLWNLD